MYYTGTMASLLDRLADPGFTPSVKQLGELLGLLSGEEEAATTARKAILKIERQYAKRVVGATVTAARAAERPGRGRLTALVATLVKLEDPAGAGLAWLVEALADGDAKTRRAAARGLGNLDRTPEIVAALATAFDAATNEEDRKALALSLAKFGDARARSQDFGRATVIAEREEARQAPASIDLDAAMLLPVWFHIRSGLEPIAKDEIGGGRLVSPGVVETTLPLRKAVAVRTAMHVGFPMKARPWKKELPDELIGALTEALPILQAFTKTEGPIRFRLALDASSAVLWRIAELVRAQVPGLLNDPKESTWEVVVITVGNKGNGSFRIELVPRGFEDERFTYRRATVPASSHPTIAAALARAVPRSEDDIVWDPFTGAGAELVERARLGKFQRLLGTDTDPKALAAARTNLKHAGVEATLTEADATTYNARANVILTNPPMGRRVERGGHADLLERFVSHAARVLSPGGSLVWLIPAPTKRIHDRAASAGLVLERSTSIDMGGFPAELAVHKKA